MAKQSNLQSMTLNELRETDALVWMPTSGNTGHWCLCDKGRIVTPKGTYYDASEVPTITFLRNKPEEK